MEMCQDWMTYQALALQCWVLSPTRPFPALRQQRERVKEKRKHNKTTQYTKKIYFLKNENEPKEKTRTDMITESLEICKFPLLLGPQ